MARLVALLLSLLACAAAASAATPAAGTVSAEAPEARWTGSTADPTGLAYAAAVMAESTADVCSTPAPACDEYALTVSAEGATRLTVAVAAEVQEDLVGLSVTTPGGEERMAFGESPRETIAIDDPAAGTYTVRVLGAPAEAAEVAYAGVATLELPPPPPPPAPPPPAPAPTPAPAPAPAPPPAEPVQAGPRELAVDADTRRVARAVRQGFRARLVCRGGCRTVRVRVFVSSLTARTYRLAKDPRGDVHVGGAKLLRNAEGRREFRITFKRSVRRKLARAKNLTLAIEAVARDADRRVRTALKRLLLRR